MRLIEIETTAHYQHDLSLTMEDATALLAELTRRQQEARVLTTLPSPKAAAGFLRKKYPFMIPSAGLCECIADTCEVRLIITRRRLAILEAGLLLKADDSVRIVAERVLEPPGILLLVTFKDELTRQRGRTVEGEETQAPLSSEIGRALVLSASVLRDWKASRDASGNPFSQPKQGQHPWTLSPKPSSDVPPTPKELRARELEEDLAAYLVRDRAVRELGEPAAAWPDGLRELLEQCDETRHLTRRARQILREKGELTEPVPFDFRWSFEDPLLALFGVRFNGVDGPGVRMWMPYDAMPIRAKIAPEKALKEWEALQVERGEIELPGPTIEEELVSLDLDNVTPRQASDILRELQSRALRVKARREHRATVAHETPHQDLAL